jgi:V8-like Glu-specific endopeptidase
MKDKETYRQEGDMNTPLVMQENIGSRSLVWGFSIAALCAVSFMSWSYARADETVQDDIYALYVNPDVSNNDRQQDIHYSTQGNYKLTPALSQALAHARPLNMELNYSDETTGQTMLFQSEESNANPSIQLGKGLLASTRPPEGLGVVLFREAERYETDGTQTPAERSSRSNYYVPKAITPLPLPKFFSTDSRSAFSLGVPGMGEGSQQKSSSVALNCSDDRADCHYPYRTNGLLFFKNNDPNNTQYYVCSAAVIRANLIVTAGHCVHEGKGTDRPNGGWFKDFLFVPVYRYEPGVGAIAPLGLWTWQAAYVPMPWVNGGRIVPSRTDFALLELTKNTVNSPNHPLHGKLVRVGDLTGYLGWITNFFTVRDRDPDFVFQDKRIFDETLAHVLGFPFVDNDIPQITQNSPFSMRVNATEVSGKLLDINGNETIFSQRFNFAWPTKWGIWGAEGGAVVLKFGWQKNEEGEYVIRENWATTVTSGTSKLYPDYFRRCLNPEVPIPEECVERNYHYGSEFDNTYFLGMLTDACKVEGNC